MKDLAALLLLLIKNFKRKVGLLSFLYLLSLFCSGVGLIVSFTALEYALSDKKWEVVKQFKRLQGQSKDVLDIYTVISNNNCQDQAFIFYLDFGSSFDRIRVEKMCNFIEQEYLKIQQY